MKKITFLFAICATLSISAQSVTNYTFSESLEAYVPVAGTNSTATGDDGAQNNIDIGFSFPFGGLQYGTFSISTNGFIRLGEALGATNWVNELGNQAAQRPLIAAFWDDHNRGTGAVRYQLSGTAPNRSGIPAGNRTARVLHRRCPRREATALGQRSGAPPPGGRTHDGEDS